MKNWHILIVFLVALLVVIVGALFKIMHWHGASILLITGMAGEAIALILLIVKTIADRNSNPTLNK
jgi:flagellar basal body-associated protein FliL